MPQKYTFTILPFDFLGIAKKSTSVVVWRKTGLMALPCWYLACSNALLFFFPVKYESRIIIAYVLLMMRCANCQDKLKIK